MARVGTRKDLEQQIAALNALRGDPEQPAGRTLLVSALDAARAPLCAAAANIIAEAELTGFEAQLVAAFERWEHAPAKSDPGCAAKTSLIRALYKVGAREHAVYVRGIKLVQHEPAWGGSNDSAVELRGLCALALVQTDYYDALLEIAELLADPEPIARIAAARAVGHSPRGDAALPLLRLKVRLGDVDARVAGACFSGLLSLAPDSEFERVAAYVYSGGSEVAEAALLALGESRSARALPLLRKAAESALASELRAFAYAAIAQLRSDEAWDYLLGVLRDESDAIASEALTALSAYRSLDSMRERVLAAARARGRGPVLTRAESLFARDVAPGG